MTRNLDVFCPETCTLASNHEQNNHRPLIIGSTSRLSSAIFVNSKGVVRCDLCQKRAEHVLLQEQRFTDRLVQMGNLAHVRERHRSYTL